MTVEQAAAEVRDWIWRLRAREQEGTLEQIGWHPTQVDALQALVDVADPPVPGAAMFQNMIEANNAASAARAPGED